MQTEYISQKEDVDRIVRAFISSFSALLSYSIQPDHS